ncbi:MAG: hypothetical protein P8J33_05380 [Pirellulaceae bacterium]|nr:hypothetical protein [Pirellulaceae bacterium]
MNHLIQLCSVLISALALGLLPADSEAQIPVNLGGNLDQAAAVTDPQDAVPAVFDADAAMNEFITKLVLKQMPHSYKRNKDWGKQAERWDGIKWDTKGGRIYTKRRKKKVNHGTWRQYSASLVDPEHQFSVHMTNIRAMPEQRIGFRLEFQSQLKLDARQTEWVKGVQLYSLSAEGKAAVRLAVDMTLGVRLDATRFPPDLIFEPRATSADILVSDFRIDRISKLGGEFAIQVTHLARRELDKEVAKKKAELVQKINREMEEERDNLRLSLAEAVKSKWAEIAMPYLPDHIKAATNPPQMP